MQISSSIGTSDNNGIEQAMKESGETLKLWKENNYEFCFIFAEENFEESSNSSDNFVGNFFHITFFILNEMQQLFGLDSALLLIKRKILLSSNWIISLKNWVNESHKKYEKLAKLFFHTWLHPDYEGNHYPVLIQKIRIAWIYILIPTFWRNLKLLANFKKLLLREIL
jgi:hypothetical protein